MYYLREVWGVKDVNIILPVTKKKAKCNVL
jgi:hypothetical protein